MEFQRVKTDQWERKQVACNTKIDVSARPTVVGGTSSLWRECEFRKVKSIMRQQRSQLTGTLGCYIWSRRKRKKLNIDEKQKQKKKKGGGEKCTQRTIFGRLTTWTASAVCDLCEELGFIWQRCLLCYKTESDSDRVLSISLVFGDRADLAKSTSAGTRFYIRDKQGQAIRCAAAAELTDDNNKHAICHFITSFHELRKSCRGWSVLWLI